MSGIFSSKHVATLLLASFGNFWIGRVYESETHLKNPPVVYREYNWSSLYYDFNKQDSSAQFWADTPTTYFNGPKAMVKYNRDNEVRIQYAKWLKAIEISNTPTNCMTTTMNVSETNSSSEVNASLKVIDISNTPTNMTTTTTMSEKNVSETQNNDSEVSSPTTTPMVYIVSAKTFLSVWADTIRNATETLRSDPTFQKVANLLTPKMESLLSLVVSTTLEWGFGWVWNWAKKAQASKKSNTTETLLWILWVYLRAILTNVAPLLGINSDLANLTTAVLSVITWAWSVASYFLHSKRKITTTNTTPPPPSPPPPTLKEAVFLMKQRKAAAAAAAVSK